MLNLGPSLAIINHSQIMISPVIQVNAAAMLPYPSKNQQLCELGSCVFIDNTIFLLSLVVCQHSTTLRFMFIIVCFLHRRYCH